MPVRAAIALAGLALGLAGCGERAEPLGPDVSAYPVTVEGAGAEPARLDAAPERIVALAPGAAEIVGALGAGERLVGVPARTPVPGADGAEQVTRPSGLVDVDAVVELEPEVIVAAGAARDDALAQAARRSGATVYVQPDRSVEEVLRSVNELGLLVGEPAEARLLAARLQEEVAAVEEAVAPLAPVRVFVDLGLLISPADDSLPVDLVRRAGGVAVGTEDAGVPRDACDVLELRPAVVLRVRDAIAPTPDPRFDACPGARPGTVRVAGLPATLVARGGPRLGQALEQVARRLHPDTLG